MQYTDIGIDLGTASILVYIRGKGVVLKEPSVVAFDRDTDKIKAIGEDARLMLGRTPGNIVAVRPLRQGVISDYKVTEQMMKHFIQKALGRKTFRKVYEVLDLGFGKCRMCVCGPASARELLQHHEMIRVASKYPRIAKDYFYNQKHQTVDIIKLNGSVELGPIVGLSDVIVDIVETGSTLRENGLEVLEEICPLSARMIVNQVSMKMESERIKEILQALKAAL